MTSLLYCSIKEIYEAKGEFYTTGSWPNFIPSLAMYFDRAYLMTSILRPTSTELMKISKFNKNERLRFIQARNAPFRRILPFWSIVNLNLFRRLQKKTDVLLIAIPSSIPYLACLPFKNKPMIAYVAGDEDEVIRASNPSLLIKIGYLNATKLAERYLLKKSDAIICMSQKLRNKLVHNYNLSGEQIYVIPEGIDTEFFLPFSLNRKEVIKNKLGLGNSQVIGFVSQGISVSKGGDSILKIFKKIKSNPAVKLLLIGQDNIGIPQDDQLIHSGFIKREEMPTYYNAMDIFMFPSRSEGAPKVVMEACACGIPVISTKIGGIPELINEGKCGFTFNPEDINGMANCCRQLLENEGMRIEMGKNARNYATKHFNSDELVKKTAEAIKRVVVIK